MKLMNTHMHLMEALTTLRARRRRHRARERLAELIAIESHAVVRDGWMAGTDRHQRDWTPVLETTAEATRARTATISRTSGSSSTRCEALDRQSHRTPTCSAAFRLDALGWDEPSGGFYDSGVGDAARRSRARVVVGAGGGAGQRR